MGTFIESTTYGKAWRLTTGFLPTGKVYSKAQEVDPLGTDFGGAKACDISNPRKVMHITDRRDNTASARHQALDVLNRTLRERGLTTGRACAI